jgi:hypothetical protein
LGDFYYIGFAWGEGVAVVVYLEFTGESGYGVTFEFGWGWDWVHGYVVDTSEVGSYVSVDFSGSYLVSSEDFTSSKGSEVGDWFVLVLV